VRGLSGADSAFNSEATAEDFSLRSVAGAAIFPIHFDFVQLFPSRDTPGNINGHFSATFLISGDKENSQSA
jgi:hypothetical protein